MAWKPIDVQQVMFMADLAGELDDWKEEVECPQDQWLIPPPPIKSK